MIKTTSKRKSESALPSGKSKQRKTSAASNDEEEAGSSQESDQMFAEEKTAAPKHVKKVRKSEPVARVAQNDEYEEDEGRMESQQFLALVEFESKKKKRAAKAALEYMERFTENIDSTNDGLKMRLANLAAASTNQTTTFLKNYQNAYGASRPLPSPPQDSDTPPEDLCFVTLFDHSQSLIDTARAIITSFETANEKTEKCEVAELLSSDWDDRLDSAAKVLAVGCNVGLEKYQALLQGAGKPVLEGEEEEVYLRALYGVDGEKAYEEAESEGVFEYGWGKVAKKGEKGLRKFVKFQRVGGA
ncbi:uncharacterized protein LY89DRAFT_781315 [Mollisia scopiformis]|uniref:Uncharacterized protein n=1 Tax=Mollisia scopiformis TaxID=149040 RepID=A0A194XDK8_MOLSC|nr:uncharacterized protein LY89DRAFT_781315 [Mollisia scopiformis]KUJ18239.1 hypothetical protein LY89DRAFT_781315 [Mollisia scopiformis]